MTARIDKRHGYVWRWCFAVKGTTQILSGWGSWDTKREAQDALDRHRRADKHKFRPYDKAKGISGSMFDTFTVRRVPCNLQPLDNYPQGFTR